MSLRDCDDARGDRGLGLTPLVTGSVPASDLSVRVRDRQRGTNRTSSDLIGAWRQAPSQCCPPARSVRHLTSPDRRSGWRHRAWHIAERAGSSWVWTPTRTSTSLGPRTSSVEGSGRSRSPHRRRATGRSFVGPTASVRSGPSAWRARPRARAIGASQHALTGPSAVRRHLRIPVWPITSTTGSPFAAANWKPHSLWAGTPITAPVPYVAST